MRIYKKIYAILLHTNFALKILMHLSNIQDRDYISLSLMLKIRSYNNIE
jgi:hypothetical protein